MLGVEPGGVIFPFGGGLPEQDEGPGEGRVLRRLPFIPDSLERIPSTLRGRAIEEAVLGRLHGSRIASIACGGGSPSIRTSFYWRRGNSFPTRISSTTQEAYLSAPDPGFFPLTSPDGGRLVPIYLGAEALQNNFRTFWALSMLDWAPWRYSAVSFANV
ncbi:unnamed protein product [Sphagnum compactum]